MTNRKKNPTIFITDDVVEAALAYERRVLGIVDGSPNYTGLSFSGRYSTGYVCQDALETLFNGCGVSYVDMTNDNGEADNGDLQVYENGGAQTLDIKGSDHIRAQNLLVNVDQWNKHVSKYDFLVAAVYHHPTVELMGWCLVSDFKKNCFTKQMLTQVMMYPHGKLPHLDELIQRLDKRE